ncbi:hypothetical protein MtrunA17_Chr4g0061101 [Medicago truncatula]|uniref:Uncharacterized protein n=1 Tax=Medicago truncatula TaxID=3880 RepID=A0A396IHD2_MEDTR|nr:hypothetical protein MtrunA17_Chr4g0061101 [Medicago truncatula]
MSSFFDGKLLDLSRRGYSKWVFDGKLLDLSRRGYSKWVFDGKLLDLSREGLILFVRRLVLIEVIPNGSLDCWIFRAEEIKTHRGGCLSFNDCYENDGSNSSRDGSEKRFV